MKTESLPQVFASDRGALLVALRDELRTLPDTSATAPAEAVRASRMLLVHPLSGVLTRHLHDWGDTFTDVLDLRVLVAAEAGLAAQADHAPDRPPELSEALAAVSVELRAATDRSRPASEVTVAVLQALLALGPKEFRTKELLGWLVDRSAGPSLTIANAGVIAALASAAVARAARPVDFQDDVPW